MGRRTLFKWLIGGLSAAMGFAVIVPALMSVLSPRRSRSAVWRPVGPLRDFPTSQTVKAIVEMPRESAVERLRAMAVYVWLKTPAEVVVFSQTCTDLGCSVRYDPGSEFYYCPCHGGIFNKAGEPVAGPPERPLYRYATRVRNGVLEIDLASVPVVA